MICSEKSNHVIIDDCISRQKTRRTARQVVYIIIRLLVVSPFSGHRLVVDRQNKTRTAGAGLVLIMGLKNTIAPAGLRRSDRSSFLPIPAKKAGHTLVQICSAEVSLKETGGILRT